MKPTASPQNSRARRAPARPPSAPLARRATPETETVLLAVTGMSPAVLTETVWALAHEAEPLIPTRVIVVTTSEGRRELERQLFTPDPRLGGRCPWDALREALSAAGHDLRGQLRFGATGDDVRVMTATDFATGRSRELSDLRSPADNEAAADFLLEQVRGIVENPDTRLIASLAGGRKTMGALLYACMTLAGRETDRLTHVLVSEPFETLRGFWFPGQPGGAVRKSEVRSQKSEAAGGCAEPAVNEQKPESAWDPATAMVELADVPFVPLRNLFLRELGRPAGRFSVLVEHCREHVRQRAGEQIRLTADQARTEIEVNGSRVKLSAREHIVLLFLATRAKRGEPAFGAYTEAVDALNAFREELRAAARPRDFSDWRHGDSLKSRFDDDQDLRKAVSGLRDKLRAAGGNARLLAPCLPEKGRFSLAVPGELIHLA
jgi:CRISPR-associated protein (TIGR02584 family)